MAIFNSYVSSPEGIQNTLQLGACVRSGFLASWNGKLQWFVWRNTGRFCFFRFSCRSFEDINRPVRQKNAMAYSAGHSPEKAISTMSCTSLITQNLGRPGGFPIWDPNSLQRIAHHSAFLLERNDALVSLGESTSWRVKWNHILVQLSPLECENNYPTSRE